MPRSGQRRVARRAPTRQRQPPALALQQRRRRGRWGSLHRRRRRRACSFSSATTACLCQQLSSRPVLQPCLPLVGETWAASGHNACVLCHTFIWHTRRWPRESHARAVSPRNFCQLSAARITSANCLCLWQMKHSLSMFWIAGSADCPQAPSSGSSISSRCTAGVLGVLTVCKICSLVVVTSALQQVHSIQWFKTHISRTASDKNCL